MDRERKNAIYGSDGYCRDHPMLLCKSVHASDFHWIHRTFPRELLVKEPEKVGIQVRHRMNPVGGRIVVGGNVKE